MKGKTTKFILGIILPAMMVMSLGLVAAAPVFAAALTSVTDTLTDDAAGATTTHTVAFTTATSLPASGKMKVAFPDGFDVSGATLGTVTGPDGSFKLSKDSQVLIVSRSGGNAFAANAVTIEFDNIVNHETAGAAYTVDVVTTDSFNGYIDGPTTSSTFTIDHAALATLVVSQQPTETVAGVAINPAVTVTAEDEFNNTIDLVDVDVALNQNAFASGTQLRTTDGSGIATFNDLIINTADTGYVLEFSDDDTGLITEDSNSFDVIPDALDALVVVDEPTDPTTAGEAIGPVTVEALDQFDNPIAGVDVDVTEVGSYVFDAGTLTQATDADGIATFGNLVIDTADTDYQLHFAAASPKTDDSVLFDVVAADLAALVVVADPTNTVAGATISTVTVRAEDEFTNVIEDVDVDVALNQNAFASGTTKQTTNASGIATFANLVIETADTDYTMTFSSGAVDSAPSAEFDVTPAALDSLEVIAQPTQTVAGEEINDVTVRAEDEFGNVIDAVKVDVALNKNAFASGTYQQTTDGSGIATFNDLIINTAATGYKLEFEDNATKLITVDSDSFDVVALTSLVMVDQPTDTVAGQVIQGASPVTVQALDTLDNPISGIVVGVTLNKNAFASGTTPQTTDVDGIATFDDLVINTAATGYKMTFASGAVNEDSALFDVEAAAVETLTVEVQPTDAAAGAVISPAVQVKAVDEFSNLIGGLDIDVTLSGTGTLGGTPTQVTAPSGIATFDDLSIDLAGEKQLQFAADEETVDSAEFDVGTISVALAKGWNLMSLPLIPDDPDIEVVLADIEDNVISVYYYNAAEEEWLLYSPGTGFYDITTMEDGKAYWINMKDADTLWLDGIVLPVPPGLPPVYEVVTGWNMVGFKSTANMPAADYLNAMAGKYTRVYGFDTGAWFAIPPPYAGDMEPGLGYWVSFTDDGTIYP